MSNPNIANFAKPKYIIRALAAGAVASLLVGCATTNNGDSIAAPPVAPAEVVSDECSVEVPCELSFRWWGGDDRQQRTLAVIALFEEQNPDIRITPMPVSFAGYYDQLAIEFAASNTPDVFQLDAARPREFGRQGLLLPLDGLIDTTNLPAAQLDEASFDGVLFAAPHTGNAGSVLLNVDLFEEAGVPLPDDQTWTWDDFLQVAQDLRAGLPAGSYPIEIIPVNMVRPFLAQRWDGGLFTPDGDVGVSPEVMAEFFEFSSDLVADGLTPAATETVQLFVVGPGESLMGTNRSAMMFAPSSTIAQMTAASGANLALARFPGESSEPYIGTAVDVGIYYGAAANTPYPEAAGRFISFMVNDPEAGLHFGVDRGVPLNPYVVAALEPTADDVMLAQFDYMEEVIAAGSRANPRAPGGELNNFINRAFEGLIFGQLTPEQAAAQFTQETQEGIDQARHGVE